MTIATCAELKAEIQSYLWDRADIAARIPTFVRLAEAQMNRRLATTRSKIARVTFAIDAEFKNVPADFGGVVAWELNVAPVVQLNPMRPDQLSNVRDGRTTLTGKPYAYAVIGTQFRFFFAPDRSYTSELQYWQKIPALVADGDTNWVLADHPDAYLYGSLLQSAPWLHEDERVPTWANAFSTIMSDIVEADKYEIDGPALQVSVGLVV
jgi:hypothetical protein